MRMQFLWHGIGLDMGMDNKPVTAARNEEMPGVTDDRLWMTLSNAGYATLKQMQNNIRKIAPRPGVLVLIHTQEIPRPHSTFDSVLLSAMDACTHLQLARFYFVSSLAATIDFLEFLVKTFPFPIAELRTDQSQLFSSNSARQTEHRFTLAAHRIGIRHSIRDLPGDDMESHLRRYFFESGIHTPGTQEDDEAFMAQLQRFLFFHNHHRSLLTLDGKTPIEMLRDFDAYRDVRIFDPMQDARGR